MNLPPDPRNCTIISENDKVCLYPSYFTHFCVLILIAITLISHLSHIMKVILLLIVAAGHCIVNVFFIRESIMCEELLSMKLFDSQ